MANKQNLRSSPARGFTLVELMSTVAVLGIVVAASVPSMQNSMENSRLKGTSEQLYHDLIQARSDALRLNSDIRAVFNTDAGSACYGFSDAGACDCTVANSCRIDGRERVRKLSDVTGLSLASASFGGGAWFDFTARRGGASSAGAIDLQTDGGRQSRIAVNLLGRPSLCSPDGAGPYSSC